MKTLELTINPKEFGLEEKEAAKITNGLTTILEERQVLSDAYLDVIKLEITEENLKTFKELRLMLVKNRTTGLGVWHKTNKAYFLAGGNFVQAIYNKEVAENERMESSLMEAEKHFENLEKQRIETLQNERIALLKPFYPDAELLGLGVMPQDVFESFLSTKKKVFEDNLAAEKQAELDRIAKEKAEKLLKDREFKLIQAGFGWDGNNYHVNDFKVLDRQTISNFSDEDFDVVLRVCADELFRIKNEQFKENAKLKAEAEKREKEIEAERKANEEKLKVEREKAEKERQRIEAENNAKLKAEQEAKAKIEAELKAKQDAEIKLENERKELELKAKKDAEKLAKAPIKNQLNTWVNGFELPSTNVDNETSQEIIKKFNSFKNWALAEIKNI